MVMAFTPTCRPVWPLVTGCLKCSMTGSRLAGTYSRTPSTICTTMVEVAHLLAASVLQDQNLTTKSFRKK